jgi:hypothetical protein
MILVIHGVKIKYDKGPCPHHDPILHSALHGGVQLYDLVTLPRANNLQYPQTRRLGETQSPSGYFEEDKSFSPGSNRSTPRLRHYTVYTFTAETSPK